MEKCFTASKFCWYSWEVFPFLNRSERVDSGEGTGGEVRGGTGQRGGKGNCPSLNRTGIPCLYLWLMISVPVPWRYGWILYPFSYYCSLLICVLKSPSAPPSKCTLCFLFCRTGLYTHPASLILISYPLKYGGQAHTKTNRQCLIIHAVFRGSLEQRE